MTLSSAQARLILASMRIADRNSNWAEIDLDSIFENVYQFIERSGVHVMAVVKANGYGHGMIQVAQTAISAGAAYCGVARVEEAFELRRAGIKVPILIFGYTSNEDIAHAVGEDIRLTVFLPEQVKAISAAARVTDRPARVHVKVDTGMSRLGIPPESALDILQQLTEAPGVEVEGIYTHFACADEPEEP